MDSHSPSCLAAGTHSPSPRSDGCVTALAAVVDSAATRLRPRPRLSLRLPPRLPLSPPPPSNRPPAEHSSVGSPPARRQGPFFITFFEQPSGCLRRDHGRRRRRRRSSSAAASLNSPLALCTPQHPSPPAAMATAPSLCVACRRRRLSLGQPRPTLPLLLSSLVGLPPTTQNVPVVPATSRFRVAVFLKRTRDSGGGAKHVKPTRGGAVPVAGINAGAPLAPGHAL